MLRRVRNEQPPPASDEAQQLLQPLSKGTRHRAILGVAADLTLLVAALVSIAFISSRLLSSSGNASAPPRIYAANEALPAALPLRLQPTERALLIAVDSRCAYCTESMPFYKAIEKARSPDTKIVFVGKEPEPVLREYAERHALQPDVIASVPRGYFKTGITPLVLLVDSGGRVLDSWVGFLDDNRQEALLRALTR